MQRNNSAQIVLNSALGLVMEDKYELEVYGCLGSSNHKLCSLTQEASTSSTSAF